MFVSHHTLKWTRTCRSHGRHPHAHPAHFLLNRHNYRSDRVSGVICSYEDLVGAGREPQGCSASSEDILLCAEDARERANCLQAIFAEIEKLPAGQRNIVRGVLVKGASQSDMARELGVSRAAVSKQLSTAVRKIRAAIRDESKETKNTTTSAVCERKEH